MGPSHPRIPSASEPRCCPVWHPALSLSYIWFLVGRPPKRSWQDFVYYGTYNLRSQIFPLGSKLRSTNIELDFAQKLIDCMHYPENEIYRENMFLKTGYIVLSMLWFLATVLEPWEIEQFSILYTASLEKKQTVDLREISIYFRTHLYE